MPERSAILDGLTTIANAWPAVAIGWHVGLATVMAGLAAGWRPPRRAIAWLLIAPLMSVAAMAWTANNPFNGSIFTLLALLLACLTLRLPRQPVEIGSPWLVAAGALLTVFGWVYPHFLQAQHWTTYLYAAPLGLIPCPTLAAVVGVTLVSDRLGSRSWSMALAVAGIGYGAIGLFALGVVLDVVLLVGALVLAAVLPRFRVRTSSSDLDAPADPGSFARGKARPPTAVSRRVSDSPHTR